MISNFLKENAVSLTLSKQVSQFAFRFLEPAPLVERSHCGELMVGFETEQANVDIEVAGSSVTLSLEAFELFANYKVLLASLVNPKRAHYAEKKLKAIELRIKELSEEDCGLRSICTV